MRTVKAPEGFEGNRCFDDGAKGWTAFARSVGSTWWTPVGSVGHAWLEAADLDARAEAAIARAVQLGMVQ